MRGREDGGRRKAAREGLGRRGVAVLGLLLALVVAPVGAQETGLVDVPPLTPEQTETAHEAMSRLRSPVTPFHTVDMCPSTGALRDSIRVAAAQGFSTSEIVEDVVARHGEHIRLLPKSRGAGLWAWIATPLVVLLGAGLIFARLRSDKEKAPQSTPGSQLSDGERERVAAALRDWEREGEVGE